jgi:Zn-dependent protease with chaperone function
MRALWSFVVVALSLLIAGLLLEPSALAGPPPTPPSGPPPSTVVPVPVPTDQAMAYYRSGNVLWGVNQVWGLAVPGAILWLGLAARMRDFAARLGRARWLPTLIGFWVIYSLFTFAVDLPLSYYAGWVRPHDYGLSDQAFGKWFGDELKSLALALVFGAMFLWIPFLLLRKSPDRWWIWTSMVAVPLAFVVAMVAPIWISPLFNDFGPMQDQQLEAEILALAERAGIEGGRVFEVDKSVDTKTVNAYVAGLGGTKRIVLWDTIIAQLEPRQLLAVMGHEMGHYVLGHVRNGLILTAVMIPVVLAVAHYAARALIRRFRDRFGFDSLSDPAALPLVAVIVGVLSFVVSPLFLAWSRHQEHASDRFALEITHDNWACASAFARLQEQNLGNPRPGLVFKTWRASHPPLGERIDFCNEYRPWETGDAEQYGELIEP